MNFCTFCNPRYLQICCVVFQCTYMHNMYCACQYMFFMRFLPPSLFPSLPLFHCPWAASYIAGAITQTFMCNSIIPIFHIKLPIYICVCMYGMLVVCDLTRSTCLCPSFNISSSVGRCLHSTHLDYEIIIPSHLSITFLPVVLCMLPTYIVYRLKP